MASSPKDGNFDLNDYGFGDPFELDNASKETPQAKLTQDVVGIDDEITVNKRTRAPAIKLDENRLLSESGIPKLKRRARRLKFKGKGHEWSDASTLLNMYRIWLDDLYPKARFVDALAMVEKAGRKNIMIKKRSEWMEEGHKRCNVYNTVEEILSYGNEAENVAKLTSIPSMDIVNPSSSTGYSLGLDKDMYGASPKTFAALKLVETSALANDVPDDDFDLEAFMAEAEAADHGTKKAEIIVPQTVVPPQNDFSAEDELMAEMPFDNY